MAESHREDRAGLGVRTHSLRARAWGWCGLCAELPDLTGHLSSFRAWPGRQLFASLGWEEGGTYMLLSLLLHIPKASLWLPGTAWKLAQPPVPAATRRPSAWLARSLAAGAGMPVT